MLCRQQVSPGQERGPFIILVRLPYMLFHCMSERDSYRCAGIQRENAQILHLFQVVDMLNSEAILPRDIDLPDQLLQLRSDGNRTNSHLNGGRC